MNLSEQQVSTQYGYRLHRLEVFNWGTFDSSTGRGAGRVYQVEPSGQTTLLIGKNGSGKSTLVDALLTLLVRPGVRNYNVAAGAKKRERDEKTYIQGAFDRRSRDEDNRSDIQYLRPGGKHYSVLLACFRNAQTGRAFTLAQILYLTADGRPERVYCFSPEERSVAADCSGIRTMDKLQQQMRERGFRATKSYQEYHQWFRKATGTQPKAMDMLNQTVAVKDIQRLNDFLRDHMLEAKPWGDKVESVLTHFFQLSEAYQSLVRVRLQMKLLEPIEERGMVFLAQEKELKKLERMIEVGDSFFRQKTIDLFTPELEAGRRELEQFQTKLRHLKEEISRRQDERRRVINEIEQTGGDRLKEIPRLVDAEQAKANIKRAAYHQFHKLLQLVGLRDRVSEPAAFDAMRAQLPTRKREVENAITETSRRRDEFVIQRGMQLQMLRETLEELSALKSRRENLPREFAELREQLCDALRLAPKEMPFAAELMAVLPEERVWETSIEMVLRSFALSLLVPERHYRIVSQYVDKTRLQDQLGRGQRLVYLKVSQRDPSIGPVLHTQSLIRKLSFRQGHPLLPWVQAELEQRFDYRCCDQVEEFQQAHGLAMTRERHIKSGSIRHTKDDRDRILNPRHFVLGWNNREKCRRLEEEQKQLNEGIQLFDQQITACDGQLKQLREQETALAGLLQFTTFDEMDYALHDREIATLKLEQRQLENSNGQIKILKQREAKLESQLEALSIEQDELLKQIGKQEKGLDDSERFITNAETVLENRRRDCSLAGHAEYFPEVGEYFAEEPLTTVDFVQRESEFKESLLAQQNRIRTELDPLRAELLKAMNRFLREFPEEQKDLDADARSLESFLGLLEEIREEGLPSHEARFKQHLNDKVTREIGLFHGELQKERAEIEDKIELLNQALCQLEYRPGTHMRLEARLVRDREITEFRTSLAECLSGSFEGSLEADEARFLRIENLVKRLREEERWRNKVTDVRRWFDFAAREIEAATGAERSYYEDSTGQSGGEKAKLAFTILVAAIAYQYDIDPNRPGNERFHFVVVDEMFSKVDDQYAEYALELFQKFGLQLLIVAPLDAKARVTEPYVGCYLLVAKDQDSRSEIHSMTAREFQVQMEVKSDSNTRALRRQRPR